MVLSAVERLPLKCKGTVKVTCKIVRVCACILGVVASAVAGQEQQLKPLPIEEALKIRSFLPRVPISLSPDGQWLAYGIQEAAKFAALDDIRYSTLTQTGAPNALVGGDIWIANTHTGQSRNLTNREGTNWAPAWSPDGRHLAFVSDRGGKPQLWLWEKSSDKMRRASDDVINPGLPFERPYEWTRDSKHIVIRLLPEGMNLEGLLDLVYGPRQLPDSQSKMSQLRVNVQKSEVIPIGAPQPQITANLDKSDQLLLSDVAVIDIQKAETIRIARQLRLIWLSVSPDSSHVGMMSYSGQVAGDKQQLLWELSLASLATRQFGVAARNLSSGNRRILWSPDSNRLAYETVGNDHKHQISFLSPIDSGKARTLTLPSDFETSDSFGIGATPWLWDGTGQTLYMINGNALWKIGSATGEVKRVAEIPSHTFLDLIAVRDNLRLWVPFGDGAAIVLTREDRTLQEGFYRVDLTTGESTKILEEPQTVSIGLKDMEVSEDRKMLTYLAEGVQHPKDIWILEPDVGTSRQVTITNTVLRNYELGSSRLVRWKSIDGQDLQGAILLPAGYKEGEHYPLIVYVYGGSLLSTTLNKWNGDNGVLNMQLLATRGYAVLFPDAPLGVGEPIGDLTNTVLPGVAKAIDLGIADPERVGIIGQSYGGYSALALVEHSKQFKAAVSISGIVNLFSSYEKPGFGVGIGWVENGQGRMGGSMWQYRDRFIENSPLFYLDRVQTPILLIHGDADQTVPVSESRMAFQSLRRLGKEVTLAEYQGEGHAPARWTYRNQVDFCNRVIAWFDKYLKGDSPRQGSSLPLSRNSE